LNTNNFHGTVAGETVILTINETLPSFRELTATTADYWQDLIQSAIEKSAENQRPPYFDKAFVWIEVTKQKYSDNSKLWDTSNRAINLIINNLKGAFFKDDNLEHMAFGVVGDWGEVGQTVIRIMEFERVQNLIMK